MSTQNICKFSPPSADDRLTVSCFVLESDPNVMTKATLCSTGRLLLIAQGCGDVQINHTRFTIHAGDILFLFSGETFSVVGQENLEYLYVSFGGMRADELLRRFSIHADHRIFSGYDGLLPLWKESLSRASEQTVDLAAESILLYTFSRLTVPTTPNHSLVNRMITLTEQRFTDPEISVIVLSRELGYNAKYLSHVFKEKTGVGYAEYLRNIRMKYAISLFDHGIDSVKNVAILSGFTDPLYFSNVFKKCIGMSPKTYKQHINEK